MKLMMYMFLCVQKETYLTIPCWYQETKLMEEKLTRDLACVENYEVSMITCDDIEEPFV